MKRFLGLLLVLVVIAGAAVGGYAIFANRKGNDAGFKEFKVTQGTITEKALATGQIEPRVKFRVKSKISGIVRRCLVEIGDAVRPGDPLFEIVPDPTPAEVIETERRMEQAQVAFNRAEADFQRISDLARQGVVSKGDLDGSRESFERTKSELARTRDNLALLRKGRVERPGENLESIIRATEAGVVLERLVNPGDPVVPLTSYQAGTDMATIADMRDLIFKGTVDEIDVGKLALDTIARLKIGSLPDKPVTGKLNRIAPQAREKDNARLFDVEIELDSGQQVNLRAGYSATAELVIREKTHVLVLPERLVHFEEKGAKAWVEVPGSVPGALPRRVDIKTGLSDGMNVEVQTGLNSGDVVIERPPREIMGK